MKLISIILWSLFFLLSCAKNESPSHDEDDGADVVTTPVPFDELPTTTANFQLAGTETHVNVMGVNRKKLPSFKKLDKKKGILRGYVKDTYGRPLSQAEIGVRASLVGGAYSSALGQSDERGYYEIEMPYGTADIFRASYTIDYHNGRAPVSLFPADSSLTSFPSTDGAVKNFVLLPYGRRHPDEVSEKPWFSSNYLGGSISISYNIRTQSLPLPGSFPEGAIIEVRLTPETLLHADEKKIISVRKTIENNGFYINNIPLGRYKIEISLADGTALIMSEGTNIHPQFGLDPKQANGAATLSFIPGAGGVMPWYGNWQPVPINLKMN